MSTEAASSTDLPPIDLDESPPRTRTATLALGCFWAPEARFGVLPGVVRTRVGYAGGTTANPTYRQLGDHIETVQIDFDPDRLTYSEVLEIFWDSHTPTRRPRKRQYLPALFVHDDEQKEVARRTRERLRERHDGRITTEIFPDPTFYLAEDYHQKYHLQQQPALRDEYLRLYPDEHDFVDSTAAARANGYAAGYGSPEAFAADLPRLGLSPSGQKKLEQIFATHQ